MKAVKILLSTAIFLLSALVLAQNSNTTSPPTGTLNPNSITTVLPMKKSMIDAIVDAAKDAKKDIKRIPIEIVKKVTIDKVCAIVGKAMMEFHLCELFDQWATGVENGKTAYLTAVFLLVEEDTEPNEETPRIVVEFFAKKEGGGTPTAGGSNSYGYMAPVNGNGKVTLQYDIFGDGTYILEKINCVSDE